MADEYTIWLDKALASTINSMIEREPEVAEVYVRTFRGDPVGLQWLEFATQSEGSQARPGPVDNDLLATLPTQLDAGVRAMLEELIPYLPADDVVALRAMGADQIAAAMDAARIEATERLVAPLPPASTDEVLAAHVPDAESPSGLASAARHDAGSTAVGTDDPAEQTTGLTTEENLVVEEFLADLSAENPELVAQFDQSDLIEYFRAALNES